MKPIAALTLGASYAYTYWDPPSATNPLTGVSQNIFIVYTPNNAASGTIDYVVPVGSRDAQLKFHLDGNYASSQYSFEAEPTKTDPSFVMNGRLSLAGVEVGVHGQKVTFALWTRNLLDHR